jgi:hypothetical protein
MIDLAGRHDSAGVKGNARCRALHEESSHGKTLPRVSRPASSANFSVSGVRFRPRAPSLNPRHPVVSYQISTCSDKLRASSTSIPR